MKTNTFAASASPAELLASPATNSILSVARAFERASEPLSRLALVVVIAWIGGMKFTAYEAEGISGLVANSPLMSWMYAVLSVRGFSTLLGLVELTIAGGLVVGAWHPRLGVVAGFGAIAVFLGTLSFLVTTPGAFEPTLGFPALSGAVGQFLIKDLVLLATSIWLTGLALRRVAVDCQTRVV
jgi:uncharacterized membrane protein YkgB